METEDCRPESSCGLDCVLEDSKKLVSPGFEFPSCEEKGLGVDGCEGWPEGLTMFGLRILLKEGSDVVLKDGRGVVKKEGREVVTKAG